MPKAYIEKLTREDRVAAGMSTFIRLWLNGMTRSTVGRDWTVAQLAMLFEVTQAYQYRAEGHTLTSLATELQMPIPTVSRQIRELIELGLVIQRKSRRDGRKKFLIPSKKFFGHSEFTKIVNSFGKHWYVGDTWSKLDKAEGGQWYIPMNHCSDPVAKKEMRRLKKIANKR